MRNGNLRRHLLAKLRSTGVACCLLFGMPVIVSLVSPTDGWAGKLSTLSDERICTADCSWTH